VKQALLYSGCTSAPPQHEEKALRILQLHSAKAVHVHEIEKRMEDIPLGSLRPDPWLGNERLEAP
jgi:hypothetical protein